MTDPGDAEDAAEGLEMFKPDRDVADVQNVNDTVGRPRMLWSSVTDSGGASPAGTAPDRSSFQFDLGSALARLGDSDNPDDESVVPVQPEDRQVVENPVPETPMVETPMVETPMVETPVLDAVTTPTPTPTPTVDVPQIQIPTFDPVSPTPVPGEVAHVEVAPVERRSPLEIEPLVLPRRVPQVEPSAGPVHEVSSPPPLPAVVESLPVREPLPTRDPRQAAEPPARSEPLPTRRPAPTAEQAPARPPETRADDGLVAPPRSEPLPVRDGSNTAPAPVERGYPEPASDPPRTYVSPSRSVFDDAAASQARPGVDAAATPTAYDATQFNPTQFDPTQFNPTQFNPGQYNPNPYDPGQTDQSRFATTDTQGALLGATPGLDPAAGMPALPKLPTLPPAVPYNPAPSSTNLVDKAPSVADVTAARTAQLRAQKKQNQGRLFKRTMIALLLVGGAIAAALVFGRGYLFPTEWDPALTPVVDAVQLEHGAEFDRTVELVRQPTAEYEATVGRLVAGESWVEQVPEWRALGLATGEPSLATVGTGIAARQLAVYDPEADHIYIATDTDPATAERDLRIAVEAAFAAQQGEQAPLPASEMAGWVALSGVDAITRRSIAFEHVSALDDAPSAPAADTAALDAPSGLPMPIEYELDAVQQLATGVAAATGLSGEQLVEPLTAVFDDAPGTATSVVAPDATYRAIGNPAALGLDDWSLVWGAHLPESMVARMASAVTADTYQVFDREGVTCVIGGFDTATPADGSYVASALTNWVNAHPPTAYASTSLVAPTRAQLVACDPGSDAVINARPDAVPLLIDRQLARA